MRSTFAADGPPLKRAAKKLCTMTLAGSGPITRAPRVTIWAALL